MDTLERRKSGFYHILIGNKFRLISQRQLTDWLLTLYPSRFDCVVAYNGHIHSDHVHYLCMLDNHNAGTATYHQRHIQNHWLLQPFFVAPFFLFFRKFDQCSSLSHVNTLNTLAKWGGKSLPEWEKNWLKITRENRVCLQLWLWVLHWEKRFRAYCETQKWFLDLKESWNLF